MGTFGIKVTGKTYAALKRLKTMKGITGSTLKVYGRLISASAVTECFP